MTTVTELTQLLAVTRTQYDQQQQSFQKLVAEENRLRQEIAKLVAASRQAQIKPDDAAEMRAIGADIIWQGWVARSKTQLNTKLAQVLAQKLHHLDQVKKAYGKVLVVEELLGQSRKDAKRKQASAALDRAIDQALF